MREVSSDDSVQQFCTDCLGRLAIQYHFAPPRNPLLDFGRLESERLQK